MVWVPDDYGGDDENAEPIHGRPDLHSDRRFGVTVAKAGPPFVFGVRRGACLVHKVQRIELHWYRTTRGGHGLVRLKRPVAIAITVCCYSFRLDPDVSRTCLVPAADALPCGRCDGGAPVFRRGTARAPETGLTRREAHVKLGCVVRGY